MGTSRQTTEPSSLRVTQRSTRAPLTAPGWSPWLLALVSNSTSLCFRFTGWTTLSLSGKKFCPCGPSVVKHWNNHISYCLDIFACEHMILAMTHYKHSSSLSWVSFKYFQWFIYLPIYNFRNICLLYLPSVTSSLFIHCHHCVFSANPWPPTTSLEFIIHHSNNCTLWAHASFALSLNLLFSCVIALFTSMFLSSHTAQLMGTKDLIFVSHPWRRLI